MNDFRNQKIKPAEILKAKLHLYEDINTNPQLNKDVCSKLNSYTNANKNSQLCKDVENKSRSFEDLSKKFRSYEYPEKKVVLRKDNNKVSLKSSTLKYLYKILSKMFFYVYFILMLSNFFSFKNTKAVSRS